MIEGELRSSSRLGEAQQTRTWATGGEPLSEYRVRDWVSIGLFSALWGVVEVTLGSAMNVAFPSFTNTFFKGVILGGIGVAIALVGRFFVQKRGSVFFIGIVTALLKLLSPGGARIGPMVAILLESSLMEAVLSLPVTPVAGHTPWPVLWLSGGTSRTSS